MSSIAALPPPSAAQPVSGVSKLRQMLASDAVAVTPIRRIPGEEERRRSSPELEAADEALKGSGRARLDETQGRTRGAGASAGGTAAGGPDGGAAVSGGPVPLTGLPNARFVAQSIHQEAMGTGLHIEPWSSAIAAYRKADAGPAGGPMLNSLAV
ncbi:hypothetical protein [Azospirillum thermophilum]|uniref:Uncharacterized protein n=1 Tax=Azospirillum thermophilum TaxID=2202148 RepID=A0A2S2CRQ6_9PROT|nr:hypothetical protein [Azospirillum thermophilum]AWK87201.1 hypothetical protein DEW08_14095 [Azospirillum thermophilum]